MAGRDRADRHVLQQVVTGARRLLEQGLVIGTTGNISARSGDLVWITPTRTRYADLEPEGLACVELPSGCARPGPVPSMELPLHLAVLRARADVGAIVHTHSPHATAWSFLGRPLAPQTEDLTYHGIGDPVLTCEPAPAGSVALAQNVCAALGGGQAVLVAGHGVVTVGDTVDVALARAAAVEHVAQVAWLLRHEQLAATATA